MPGRKIASRGGPSLYELGTNADSARRRPFCIHRLSRCVLRKRNEASGRSIPPLWVFPCPSHPENEPSALLLMGAAALWLPQRRSAQGIIGHRLHTRIARGWLTRPYSSERLLSRLYAPRWSKDSTSVFRCPGLVRPLPPMAPTILGRTGPPPDRFLCPAEPFSESNGDLERPRPWDFSRREAKSAMSASLHFEARRRLRMAGHPRPRAGPSNFSRRPYVENCTGRR
jgi:hypothetical protein